MIAWIALIVALLALGVSLAHLIGQGLRRADQPPVIEEFVPPSRWSGLSSNGVVWSRRIDQTIPPPRPAPPGPVPDFDD